MIDKNKKGFDGFLYGINGLSCDFDFSDKKNCTRQHIVYMLNRTRNMFKWDGLPDTIPERVLELYLQINGNCCFYKYNGNLYIFTGGMGGEPDMYYMPTKYTVANPFLSLFKTLDIDVDCVVVPNDSMYIGMIPLFSRYAKGLTETELSIKIATVNTRIPSLISAPDDRTRASAEKYLRDIEDGKTGIIAEIAFLNGIKAQPYGSTGNTNYLTNLIELEQYFKASWYNEIGLNANYNMKRESLNSSESQLNNDALLPLVDDMLKCRKENIEKVNAMFGTNIDVSLNSSWEDNQEEIDAQLDNLSGQPENDVSEVDENEFSDNPIE